jgi:hypothetical protein
MELAESVALWLWYPARHTGLTISRPKFIAQMKVDTHCLPSNRNVLKMGQAVRTLLAAICCEIHQNA